MMIAAMKLKDAYSLEESYDQPRQHIKKQRQYFVNKGPSEVPLVVGEKIQEETGVQRYLPGKTSVVFLGQQLGGTSGPPFWRKDGGGRLPLDFSWDFLGLSTSSGRACHLE